MKLSNAIEYAAQYFASVGEFYPSHCDVRCTINDLTRENPRIMRHGYDQDRAFARVRNILKNAAIVQQ